MTRSTLETPSQSGGAAPPASTLPLRLEDLVRRCMGDRAFALKTLRRVRATLPEQLAELDRWCGSEGDCEEAARASHRLKGTAASVSAEPLREALGALEELARAGLGERLPEAMRDVRRQWERLADVLEVLQQPE